MKRMCGAVAIGLVVSGGALADIIATYDFTGNSFASSTSVAGVSASNLSNGAGVPLATNGSQGNPAPTLQFSFGDVGADLVESLGADDYYSFTVTPSGTALTYEQVSFDFFKSAAAGANVQAVLFSDVDGFSNGDELGLAQLSGGGESGSFQARTIDLSALPDNQTTPVEFRLYIHDSEATNQANLFRIDNLVVESGVSVVPEPMTAVLLALGLPAVAWCRRGRGIRS